MRAGKAQGAICDKCHVPIEPFDKIRVITIKHLKGKNFRRVSSDITQKTLATLDLCETCYEDYLRKMCEWLNT